MNELRKDYFLDRYVLYAAVRAKRPKQFQSKAEKKASLCFFCPGNEKTTPPEIGRIPKGKSWTMRWFPNKFPIVNEILDKQCHFTKGETYHSDCVNGKHEVFVETPDHNKQLANLPASSFDTVIEVYKERVKTLEKKYKYVVVFKNEGADAGTSLIHSHTQILALDFIPPLILEKTKKSYNKGKCLYCEILKKEMKTKRKVFENKTMAAFTPYASQFQYEVWIFPKRHIETLNELKPNEQKDMANILQKILSKLGKYNFPYNFIIDYAPKGKKLHLHLEVKPRLAKLAGFEYGSGLVVNTVMPEDAAKFYRR